MNKIEQRVQRYKEDHQILVNFLYRGGGLITRLDNITNFLNAKRQLEEKFLADIVTLSKTLQETFQSAYLEEVVCWCR